MKVHQILTALEKIYVLFDEDKDSQFKEYNMRLFRESIEDLRKAESECQK